ncbi:MAG: Holliday junction DNA helicase RuvA [Desulfatitalea sp.]|nr:Holliday junction DNA helicase RuvA [Desulfatitalea sp.]NNK01575.1 Holliday junction DNA helicase RuvA [Desulfatitalea sp.]
MIAYIEGRLLKKDEDRILLLANQVGYEIILPAFVCETLNSKQAGDQVALFIYYHQTERQPKPVLIGFNLEAEKEFFQIFISVDAVGPMKAVKALTIPIRDIADAIESNNLDCLKRLRGIGPRTAQKIIAALQGKVSKFSLIRKLDVPEAPQREDFQQPVLQVLVDQLGHKPVDAKRMISQALARNSAIQTPEALFDEVYRGERE